eukprot:snap_masked-scaffold_59-processed-gene-0.64-mRNA-1 protein AED:1.00 eAED:1.00 QI:0/-1/0/0/-1/1/1/0/195
MKFQYLLGFAPIFVQGLEDRALYVDKFANALNNLVMSNTKVTSTRQECEFLEYEDILDCASDLIEVAAEISKDLSDEELEQLDAIIDNDELSIEEKADQITAILGEPGLCIPEFLEVLPQLAFCGLKCEDGFCEANEVGLGGLVTEIAADFGCELVLDDVCEVFNDITGDAVSFSAVGLGGVITLINIMVNEIAN